MSGEIRPWYCVKDASGKVVTFDYWSFQASQFPAGYTVEKYDAEQPALIAEYRAAEKAKMDAAKMTRDTTLASAKAKLKALGLTDAELSVTFGI